MTTQYLQLQATNQLYEVNIESDVFIKSLY